ELNRLKEKINIGHELEVKWIPGTIRFQNGKQLEEEVKGNMIFIYVEQHDKAIELMKHGFVEWLLNQHSKPYRQLINKLIDVFEEIQYERKEKIIEALTKLL
ncbi:MAG: hypothetical protein QXG01_01515, partial [Candidatus Bathyarchaeia archaeon]